MNGSSLLGATHNEAVRAIKSVATELKLLVCDGFDVTSSQLGDNQSKFNASTSSIDRESEETRIAMKVMTRFPVINFRLWCVKTYELSQTTSKVMVCKISFFFHV